MSLCSAATAGNDAFVRHPITGEEGMIDSCSLKTNHFVVKTAAGRTRVWDYRECTDLERPKLGPMS
ncbi:hypothetical protein SAMN02745165_00771 [Malonomonas rubra DSM 5091]|uniref:Uncharacterized protein n=1 Tax=Malonomonas rubra DSM 5091 TaxID=1122189 RepID=A0A1M6DQM4_MALRU|nr:hypothetical protein [Malonomonas rubra]SHI75450.1 hypothetical protein SAMN02745165_00771 [Malonomonas rubra DSM 5091]